MVNRLIATLGLLMMACSPPKATTTISSQSAVTIPEAGPSAPPLAAGWVRSEDDAGVSWLRRGGESASPLVIRGTLLPRYPRDNAMYEPFVGARFGAAPVTIETTQKRELHVWVKSRGPVGILLRSETTATAGANEWVKVDVPPFEGPATLEIAEVDHAGDRRGQTSPYVLVVSDEDVEPTEQPDPRPPADPADIKVRWMSKPVPCQGSMEAEYWKCSRVSIVLSGFVTRTIPVQRTVMGQTGCWPDDVGITCAGASGSSSLSMATAADGTVTLGSVAFSDGYCPPEEPDHCAFRTTWATFQVPAGHRLVPDPLGTFPPP